MSGEKTEQPTSKRLRDSREKGDIPKSTEVVSAATVVGVVAFFVVRGDDIFYALSDELNYILQNSTTMPYDKAIPLLASTVVSVSISIVLPLVAIVMMSALIALLAQTGFLFAPKAAVPKLSNLSPKKWVKKVFSKKNLFEFVKNILKVTVLTVVVANVVRQNIREIFKIQDADLEALWLVLANLLKSLMFNAVGAFIFIAAIDFLYTKFKYTKDHMMSQDEVRREFKESEGDPHIKQKRKQMHQEMINQNTVANTRKSKVVVVNPTHYAVAIDYEQGRTELPVILAKGQGHIALRMIAVAKEENIPVMREPPLARALYAQGNENEYVPSDLLVPVAKILQVIAKLEEKK